MRHLRRPRLVRADAAAETFARALKATDLKSVPEEYQDDVLVARALTPARSDAPSETFRQSQLEHIMRLAERLDVPTAPDAGSKDPSEAPPVISVRVNDPHLGVVRMADVEPIDADRAATITAAAARVIAEHVVFRRTEL